MKKVTIIVGHPLKESLSGTLAEAYKNGAKKSGKEVKIIYLGDLKFDPLLKNGYKQKQEWETDLKKAVDDMLWADSWIFIYPIWWGIMPALLKGFIDRTFVPGIMYKPPIKNKKVRVIATMDGPLFYHKLVVGSPDKRMMKKSVMMFCGILNVKFNYFDFVKKANKEKIEKWKKKIENIAKKD